MSRRNRRTAFLAVWGIGLSLALAACGLGPGVTAGPQVSPTAAETATPAPTFTPTPFKPELVVCTRTEPDALIGSASPAGVALSALVAGRAVVFGTGYEAQPDLLRALPSEANGTLRHNDDGTISVVLQYRDDLKWSDGTPFLIADALLGLKAAPPPGAPLDDIVDMRAGDNMMVLLTLAAGAEYPYIPAQPPLPSYALSNVDPAQLSANAYARTVNPSLGSYYVSEWSPGDHILLQANPYANPMPAIPVIRVRFLGDPSQAVGALTGSGCDVVLDDALGIEQLAALDQAAAGGTVRDYKTAGSLRDEIVFNTYPVAGGRVPYFADTLVRQAIAYGFDRAGAVQQLGGGVSPLLDGWIPGTHWAAGGGGFKAYTLDAGRAGALLDQAGWRDEDGDGIREYHGTGGDYSCQRGKWSIADQTPLTPTLILPDGDPRRLALAQKLQSDLKAIGIGLQLQPASPANLFDRSGPIQHRDFDAALISLAIGPDPGGISQFVGADVFKHPLDKTPVHRWQLEQRWLDSEQLVERLALSNVPSPDNDWQGQNYAGWCNEQADITVVQANLSFDANARKGSYAQAEALVAGDAPIIPLAYRPRLAASRTYVCGIQPGPYDTLLWNVASWRFDPQGTCSP